MSADYQALAAFAGELAEAARTVTNKYFRTAVAAEVKADKSPVTIADQETEALIREKIETAYPDHGIYGEEYGAVRTEAEFVWVLDPIDGTKSFITGKPMFGTLIGLLHAGRAVVGVIDMPALRERWIGNSGGATIFNGTPVRARSCPDLANAWMYVTSPQMFKGPQVARFEALRDASHYTMYGGDCEGYGLVASGWADVVCEASMSPYDYVALVPVVEGAGGAMSDWSGRPLGLEGDGSVLAVGDPALHGQILEILGG